MDEEKIGKIISDIVNQSIDQAALLFNYNETFNSIIVSEIKTETNSITKLNKFIHVLIEQLTTYQKESKNANLNNLQSSILKIYPTAPKEISRFLKWIPKKMAKEKRKIDPRQENVISTNYESISIKNKDGKMKQEIEQLKAKCTHLTKSITLLKENLDKIKETPDNYLEEIRQLKQANIELHENLANAKMQNKLLKSKISSIKKQNIDDKKSTKAQTKISNLDGTNENSDQQSDDRYEVLFYELKTLKNEKEKSEQKYLSNVEYSITLEEKIRKIQIERDSLQAKLNDQINLMKKKEDLFKLESEKCEKLSQNCLRLETQITKLKDRLNQQNEPYIPISSCNNNYIFNDSIKINDCNNNNFDAMINPFEIEFK